MYTPTHTSQLTNIGNICVQWGGQDCICIGAEHVAIVSNRIAS